MGCGESESKLVRHPEGISRGESPRRVKIKACSLEMRAEQSMLTREGGQVTRPGDPTWTPPRRGCWTRRGKGVLDPQGRCGTCTGGGGAPAEPRRPRRSQSSDPPRSPAWRPDFSGPPASPALGPGRLWPRPAKPGPPVAPRPHLLLGPGAWERAVVGASAPAQPEVGWPGAAEGGVYQRH